MIPEKVNLAQKFEMFADRWSPRIVGEVNDSAVKLVKLKGEFLWHHHEKEDELFLVVRGRITIRFREGDVRLEEDELLIVPRGMEHMPVAEEEAWVLLFEPKSTVNTGEVRSERTITALGRI